MNNNVRYFYCYMWLNGKCYRVCMAYTTEGVTEGKMRVAFAFCSPKDQFVKKTGRAIARIRLGCKNYASFEMDNVFNNGDINATLLYKEMIKNVYPFVPGGKR